MLCYNSISLQLCYDLLDTGDYDTVQRLDIDYWLLLASIVAIPNTTPR